MSHFWEQLCQQACMDEKKVMVAHLWGLDTICSSSHGWDSPTTCKLSSRAFIFRQFPFSDLEFPHNYIKIPMEKCQLYIYICLKNVLHHYISRPVMLRQLLLLKCNLVWKFFQYTDGCVFDYICSVYLFLERIKN